MPKLLLAGNYYAFDTNINPLAYLPDDIPEHVYNVIPNLTPVTTGISIKLHQLPFYMMLIRELIKHNVELYMVRTECGDGRPATDDDEPFEERFTKAVRDDFGITIFLLSDD